MDPSVDNDPGDEESGKAGQESLLGQLPRTTIFSIVHALKVMCMVVLKKYRRESGKAGQESLLGQLPRTTIFSIVHALKVMRVVVFFLNGEWAKLSLWVLGQFSRAQ